MSWIILKSYNSYTFRSGKGIWMKRPELTSDILKLKGGTELNEILKKIDKSIDDCKKKGNNKIDINLLITYVIDKINQNTTTENSISDLESILRKLLANDFPITVKLFCYYIIANFNQEFSQDFFASI